MQDNWTDGWQLKWVVLEYFSLPANSFLKLQSWAACWLRKKQSQCELEQQVSFVQQVKNFFLFTQCQNLAQQYMCTRHQCIIKKHYYDMPIEITQVE